MKLTIQQASSRYGATYTRLLQAVRRGKIPAIKILGRYELDSDVLDKIFNYSK